MSEERPINSEKYPFFRDGLCVTGKHFDPDAPHSHLVAVGKCGLCGTVYLFENDWEWEPLPRSHGVPGFWKEINNVYKQYDGPVDGIARTASTSTCPKCQGPVDGSHFEDQK